MTSTETYKCTTETRNGIFETKDCTGEPYLSSYFKLSTNAYSGDSFYENRRKVLFNLYAFADFFSTVTKPPTLEIKNCEFDYFLYDYEALIYVETY